VDSVVNISKKNKLRILTIKRKHILLHLDSLRHFCPTGNLSFSISYRKERACTFICPPAEFNSPKPPPVSAMYYYSPYHPTHNMETGLLRHQPSAKWRAVFWVCLVTE